MAGQLESDHAGIRNHVTFFYSLSPPATSTTTPRTSTPFLARTRAWLSVQLGEDRMMALLCVGWNDRRRDPIWWLQFCDDHIYLHLASLSRLPTCLPRHSYRESSFYTWLAQHLSLTSRRVTSSVSGTQKRFEP